MKMKKNIQLNFEEYVSLIEALSVAIYDCKRVNNKERDTEYRGLLDKIENHSELVTNYKEGK